MKRKSFIRLFGGIGIASVIPSSVSHAAHLVNGDDTIRKEKIVKTGDGAPLNVLGDHMNIKLTGKDTQGQYTMIEQDNSPGTGIPKHVHTKEDEVFRIIQGEVQFEVGDKVIVLTEGDAIFLPRNIPHSFKVIGTKNAKVILNIFPAGLEKMFEELSRLPAGPPDLKTIAKIGEVYGLSYI